MVVEIHSEAMDICISMQIFKPIIIVRVFDWEYSKAPIKCDATFIDFRNFFYGLRSSSEETCLMINGVKRGVLLRASQEADLHWATGRR